MVSGIPALALTCGVETLVEAVDHVLERACSPSPVKVLASDPLLSEDALCTPWKVVSERDTPVHSIDIWPRAGRSARAARWVVVGAVLTDDFNLCSPQAITWA